MSAPEAERGPAACEPVSSDTPDLKASSVQALVVDDDRQIRMTVAAALEDRDFSTVFAATAEEGIEVAKSRRFEVVLLDLRLPGMSGLEMLERLRRLPRPPETVVLTGRPEADTAVEAMKLGAFDYLSKPFDALKLVATLKNAATKHRLSRENTTLRRVVVQQQPHARGPIVVDSPEMKQILRIVDKVAPSDASVLIQGETGTGKGLMAKLIHSGSRRAGEAQMHINCSALNETLLESELFGHEKGAFTGATESKPGLFEVADGGTLFLDEVGEMSPAMQAKLLQVLDSGELRRVGGTSVMRVDARIVAATNRDLQLEVERGNFREDLLFRLKVVSLALPPLRERKADIPGLVHLYLERHRLAGQSVKTVSDEAMAALCAYAWPGNVRELSNVVEGLVLLASSDQVEVDDLPPNLWPQGGDRVGSEEVLAPESAPPPLAEIQRRHIVRTLRYTEGKKAPAARLLGIDVKTLYSKIKLYEIEI